MNHILREQVAQFEENADKVLAGNLISSLMLVSLIYPAVSARSALFWLLLQVMFNTVRLFMSLHHRRRVLQTEEQVRFRYRHHLLMTIISGLIWGLSAFIIFPEHSSEYQLLYLLVMVGYVASALSLSNLLPLAYPILMLILVICIAPRLAALDEPYSTRLIIIILLFAIMMLIVVARAFRIQYVESISLKLELHQQAYQDVLTRLFNRRYFMERLKEEWFRSIRNQQPISIILLDIDHFKRLNDRYGHQKGDECLVEIAAAMAQSVNRVGDFVARIGGEEFVMVLPSTNQQAAVGLAEKVRERIAAIRFKHQGEPFSVTVSMGIASVVPPVGSDCERLFNMADLALYQAKENGRNRYEIADLSDWVVPETQPEAG